MTILSALQDRLSTREPSPDEPDASPGAQSGPPVEAGPPFEGYERLDASEVVKGMSDHSQVELEAVEGYERSHRKRKPVLDKLRFMRQREPLPGYDALSVEEIRAGLDEADAATIKKLRSYERKFANRPDVLEEVVRIQGRRRATEPASTAPAYQALSAKAGVRSARAEASKRGARKRSGP